MKEFNPTRIEVAEPMIKDKHNPGRVRIFCLCGVVEVYNANQKKRIADCIEFHKRTCTPSALIEQHRREIRNCLEQMRESYRIIANLNNPKDRHLVVNNRQDADEIQKALLDDFSINATIADVGEQMYVLAIYKRDLINRVKEVNETIKKVFKDK